MSISLLYNMENFEQNKSITVVFSLHEFSIIVVVKVNISVNPSQLVSFAFIMTVL